MSWGKWNGRLARHAAQSLRNEAKKVRKLLLHKREINRLIGLTSIKGNSLIATKIFEKNGYIKIELALAKGKRDYDKRKKITKKQHQKEMKDYK